MKFIDQILPTGTNAEHIVHALLTEKNHHFGNALLSWQVLFLLRLPEIDMCLVVMASWSLWCLHIIFGQ
jgi:hypothetical protein